MNIRIEYDRHGVEAIYLTVREGKSVRTEEVAPEVLVDFNANGLLLGVELLNPDKLKVVERLSRRLRTPELRHAREAFQRAAHQVA